MPGEGRQHGFHVQFPLAGHDPLLQLHLCVEPALGQRRLPVVEVRHPVPRQVGRAGEIAAYLLVGEPELLPHPRPYGLLAVIASGRVTPLSAIQSISRSQSRHCHHTIVYPNVQ